MPANSWRGRVGIIWTEYAANASEMTLRENIPLPRYAHPAMNPRVLWFNSRAQVKAPPSFELRSPSPSREKNYRTLERSNTAFFRIDPYTAGNVPKTFVNFSSSKSKPNAFVVFN